MESRRETNEEQPVAKMQEIDVRRKMRFYMPCLGLGAAVAEGSVYWPTTVRVPLPSVPPVPLYVPPPRMPRNFPVPLAYVHVPEIVADPSCLARMTP